MDLDMAEVEDFKSLRNKFQYHNSSSTLSANTSGLPSTRNRDSSIVYNPAFQQVRSVLENNLKAQTLPHSKKPDIPKKPQFSGKFSNYVAPPLKVSGIHANLSDSEEKLMKPSKISRRTWHMDTTRGEADGMCESLPQKYNMFRNTGLDLIPVPPEVCYETVDVSQSTQEVQSLSWKSTNNFSTYASTMPISDRTSSNLTSESKPSPPSSGISAKGVDIAELPCLGPCPVTDNNHALLTNTPKVKPLQSTELLGPPPKKPPRPPKVDLSVFSSISAQKKLNNHKIDAADSEVYEESFENPTLDHEECYQDVLESSEGRENLYATETDNGFNYTKESCYEVAVEDQQISTPGDNESMYEDRITEGLMFQNYGQTHQTKEKNGMPEQALRKKFKISGSEEVLYKSRVLEDCKGGKNYLSAMRGESVDIVRITDCPSGKWLARNDKGHYGFIPVSSVEMDKSILEFSNHRMNLQCLDIYDDTEQNKNEWRKSMGRSMVSDNHSQKFEEMYDDISGGSSNSKKEGTLKGLFKEKKVKEKKKGKNENTNFSSKYLSNSTFYIPGNTADTQPEIYETEITPKTDRKIFDGKRKQFDKEEKQFRKAFQYTKEIEVINIAIVNISAPLMKNGRLDLAIKPGEELQVVDVTDGNQVICRNSEGKFGYVLIDHLTFKLEAFSL